MEIDIVTDRCRLRPFNEADLHRFATYRASPEVAKYQSWSSFSYDQALTFYQELSAKPFGQNGEWYQIAVAHKITDDLLGDLAIHFIDRERVEIGFTMSPECQGQGYAKEAVIGLLSYLFNNLEYCEVHAITDVRNIASIRLLESVGFVNEALSARQVIFKGEAGEEFDYLLRKEIAGVLWEAKP